MAERGCQGRRRRKALGDVRDGGVGLPNAPGGTATTRAPRKRRGTFQGQKTSPAVAEPNARKTKKDCDKTQLSEFKVHNGHVRRVIDVNVSVSPLTSCLVEGF